MGKFPFNPDLNYFLKAASVCGDSSRKTPTSRSVWLSRTGTYWRISPTGTVCRTWWLGSRSGLWLRYSTRWCREYSEQPEIPRTNHSLPVRPVIRVVTPDIVTLFPPAFFKSSAGQSCVKFYSTSVSSRDIISCKFVLDFYIFYRWWSKPFVSLCPCWPCWSLYGNTEVLKTSTSLVRCVWLTVKWPPLTSIQTCLPLRTVLAGKSCGGDWVYSENAVGTSATRAKLSLRKVSKRKIIAIISLNG